MTRSASEPLDDGTIIIEPDANPVAVSTAVLDPFTEGGGPGTPPKKRKRTRLRKRFPRTFRVLMVIFAVFLTIAIWASWSFYQAVRTSEGEPLEVIAATWARDHGLGSAVAVAEDFYYQHIETTPEGGVPTESTTIDDGASAEPAAPAPAKSAPGKPSTAPAIPVVGHLTPPDRVQSPAGKPLPNEGVWQPTKGTVAGVPAVYVTRVRPDNVHTSVLVSMMWFDTNLAKFGFVPGYQEPGGPSPTDGAMPASWQDTALASFNGGFRLQDSRGGYYYNGDTVAPLSDGAASAVIYKDGSMKIGEWGRTGLTMSKDVAVVRQNLDLIVDKGQAQTFATDSGARWGATTDGASLAWRSAVGQRKDGSIVYIGSPGLSASSLASTLVDAGVQRAMILDMNNWWVAGFYYSHTANGQIKCANLDPAIQEGCDRFLKRYKRDNFAVLGKTF